MTRLNGVVYRHGESYNPPMATVADIVRHEQYELGNQLHIDREGYQQVMEKPARYAIWVCLDLDAVASYDTYGPLETWQTNAIIVANDGMDGYLIYEESTQHVEGEHRHVYHPCA